MTKKLVLNSDTAAEFIMNSQLRMCAKYRDQLIEEGVAIADATVLTNESLAVFEVIFQIEESNVERLLDITDEYDPKINQDEVSQASESAIQIYDQAIKRYVRNIAYAEKLPVYHRIRVKQSRADRIVALIQKQVVSLPRDIAVADIDSFESNHLFAFLSVNELVYKFFEIVGEDSAAYDESHLTYVCASIQNIYKEVLRA